jgi:hypothetical protein
MKQAYMALTNSRERYRVFRGAGTLFKHLFRKHGAPQQASGYSAPKEPSVSELAARDVTSDPVRETVTADA